MRIKDETDGVAGSHKARHLMGVLIHLELVERLGRIPPEDRIKRPLAIASCGNAALAAAVLARAAGRPLRVFIPLWASPSVRDRLLDLNAELVVCEREADTRGDPCLHAFRTAVAGGALPFCCQGPDCGLSIDGGRTLGYELVAALLEQGLHLDRLFIQVGGGALASATIQGLEDAAALGALPGGLPRIHAVQAAGNAPLVRAWERVGGQKASVRAAEQDTIERILAETATRRSAFMWPWEKEPKSVASGILDDETYDWLAVIRGMLLTGGSAIMVAEPALEQAAALGREVVGLGVGPTGAAGLAGLLHLHQEGSSPSPEETVCMLFTGAT